MTRFGARWLFPRNGEATPEGILIRPAVAMPVEIYSPERRGEFLLSNATKEEEYQAARTEVVALGLNPEEIQHLYWFVNKNAISQ